ncbi:MAG: hypothetical protein KBB26_00435 [Candidatus Omnitrophica bacterium]|nr:hypothetical protein [Candidatus Omnitrophota bacterium]
MQRTFKPGQNVSRLEAKFNVQFLVVRGGLTVNLDGADHLEFVGFGSGPESFS